MYKKHDVVQLIADYLNSLDINIGDIIYSESKVTKPGVIEFSFLEEERSENEEESSNFIDHHYKIIVNQDLSGKKSLILNNNNK